MRGPVDPVEACAKAVCDGGIVAGPHVRNACRRHILDLDARTRARVKLGSRCCVATFCNLVADVAKTYRLGVSPPIAALVELRRLAETLGMAGPQSRTLRGVMEIGQAERPNKYAIEPPPHND
jgi:hypothetical protein